jgi:hypothetical protein
MLQRTQFAVILLVAGLAPLYAGKPAGCTDIPTQWTLNDYYVDGATLNAIRADNLGPYKNGQSGASALIKICDVNGTNNAVLMTGSSRQLKFDFGHILASNADTPSWATSLVIGSGGVLNVQNITFVTALKDRSQEYEFTTWFGSDVPVKGSWNFRMWNPTTDAVVGDPTNPNVVAANTPYADTVVEAYHCPANNPAPSSICTGVTHETWFVSPAASSIPEWVGGWRIPGRRVPLMLANSACRLASRYPCSNNTGAAAAA